MSRGALRAHLHLREALVALGNARRDRLPQRVPLVHGAGEQNDGLRDARWGRWVESHNRTYLEGAWGAESMGARRGAGPATASMPRCARGRGRPPRSTHSAAVPDARRFLTCGSAFAGTMKMGAAACGSHNRGFRASSGQNARPRWYAYGVTTSDACVMAARWLSRFVWPVCACTWMSSK